MLTLYIRPGCPYCGKVLKAAEAEGIVFSLKSIADPVVAEELSTRGGKVQVPYLVDEARQVEMYESDDIVAYLKEHYAHHES